MKKFFILTMSLVLFFSLSSISFAAKNKLSEEDVIGIKNGFTELGVDNKTQDKLIKKIESGQFIDSINPLMKDTGISVESSSRTAQTIFRTTTTTYPDGSVKEQTVELPLTPNDGISTFASIDTSNAIVTGGTGYKNIQNAIVKENLAIYNDHFSADYTFVQGGDDYISNVYDYHIQTFGGVSSNEYFQIEKASESLAGPARATLRFTYAAYNNGGSQTIYLYLYVANDHANAVSS